MVLRRGGGLQSLVSNVQHLVLGIKGDVIDLLGEYLWRVQRI